MDTNCTRLDEWLADQLDAPEMAAEPELPAEWGQHVAGCTSCAQRWHDERRLAAAMVAWRASPPRPPATSTLVATLLAEVAARHPAVPAKSASRRVSWWPMVAATAALVIVGIGLTRLTSPDPATQWNTAATTPDDEQQLALTNSVGSLMSQFEGTSLDMLTASQNALPRFPAFQQTESTTSPFETGEIIDPAAPSDALRYGQPLGHGLGEAFRFLQIAVPIPTTDAG